MRLTTLPLVAASLSLFTATPAGAQVLWPHFVDDSQSPAPQLPPPSLFRSVSFRTPTPTSPATAALVSVSSDSPGRQCRLAIRAAEEAAHVPDQLMAAIGRIESGRRDTDGTVNPWPWSINAEGIDHVYDTKAKAIAAVQALQRHGVRSIDVGCMQVNLQQHPHAFASLAEAFDPAANAAYAAHFLVQLREQTGSWQTATAWYHSATPGIGAEYRRKVMAVWPTELKQGRAIEQQARQQDARIRLASAWAATVRPTPVAPSGMSARQITTRRLPQAAGTTGRGLSVYRAEPIPVAGRTGSSPG